MTATSALSASNANPLPDLPAIRDPDTATEPSHSTGPTPRRFPSPRFGDYSRTRFESRVAFSGPDEDAEEIATLTWRFGFREITSGLPDDSREEDERAAQRELHNLRSRVKIARAVVSTTPGLADALREDWRRAARFFARFGITEGQFRNGVSASGRDPGSDEFDVALGLAGLPATLKGTVFIPDEWSASPHPTE
jgi:hypothetical protein